MTGGSLILNNSDTKSSYTVGLHKQPPVSKPSKCHLSSDHHRQVLLYLVFYTMDKESYRCMQLELLTQEDGTGIAFFSQVNMLTLCSTNPCFHVLLTKVVQGVPKVKVLFHLKLVIKLVQEICAHQRLAY